MAPTSVNRFVRWGASALALLVLSADIASAQGEGAPPAPPPLFVIRNARIVVAPGRVIEKGSIVLKDGLVSAVGATVAAPAGAWVIDGTGLVVYPGLVDGMSTVGLPASLRIPEPQRGGGGGQGGGQGQAAGAQTPYSWGPDDRPATFTWISAADELSASDDRVAKWRNGGFTAAIVVPERGFFPGQASYVNLAGDRGNDMVVKSPVAMRTTLAGGPSHRGYPNSLMGAIAYLRQTLFDAVRYDQAQTIYQATPAGLERPQYDKTLEPLGQALRAKRPMLFAGNLAKEIGRAVSLAQETGATPVVYGAQEAYRIAPQLKTVQLLVNLDWPVRDRDADPDADVALATLRLRDRAPTTPAELEKAGVKFAFYSGKITDPAVMLANVRKSIKLGLSPDGALRAFTTAPAEIFGVADRVGTLEGGKIANLIVVDGDLWDSKTKIRHVFVDGRKFEPAAAVAQADTGASRRPAANDSVVPVTPMVKDRGPLTDNKVTLIRGATILTASHGTIENGSILIRDGKIAQGGQNIPPPAGAAVIEAAGKYVIPGIIDAHSHIAADAINEGAVSVSAMVGIRDVIDPDAIAIYRALAGGVTAAHVLHGSANTIGGKNQLLKLRWGADAKGLIFEGAKPTIKFALGENVTRDRDPDRYPLTRMGVQDVVRQAFLEAREHQRQWREYEAAKKATPAKPLIPPRRDLKLETLGEILDGKRVIHSHSYREDEIFQLMQSTEEFGVHVNTFQHVLEGYKVADELAKHGAMASTFSDWWAYKVEAYDAIPYNAALMTERGVVVSINSDDAEEMRHLNQEAAKAMHWGGLSENDALKLVTLNPAIQTGVDKLVGSIDVGKDADLVIYTNHPLSVYSVVEQTLVDGQVYFDRQKDIARRKALEDEKKALLDKEKPATRERPRVTSMRTEVSP